MTHLETAATAKKSAATAYVFTAIQIDWQARAAQFETAAINAECEGDDDAAAAFWAKAAKATAYIN